MLIQFERQCAHGGAPRDPCAMGCNRITPLRISEMSVRADMCVAWHGRDLAPSDRPLQQQPCAPMPLKYKCVTKLVTRVRYKACNTSAKLCASAAVMC